MAETLHQILDGLALSKSLRGRLGEEVSAFRKANGSAPGLAVVLVGADPASAVYVKKKTEACREAGFASFEHRLPESTSEKELRALLDRLNRDPAVHGILVQLPLPAAINSEKILAAVHPHKDVDGFHPENVGLLALGKPRFVPCTPLGIMKLLENARIEVAGKDAVVIGRSNIVGKPVAQLLLGRNATVTICHSKTAALKMHLSRADLVIAAIGRPGFVHGDDLKTGAVVIDVGINRLPTGKLTGDVDFASASKKAAWITPVPGGVGPMTIACLLDNTFAAAKAFAKERS